MPGTGNLTIDGAGWKGPVSIQANKRIHVSHRSDGRFEWCAIPSGTGAPDEILVGHPLLSDTQRIQNGLTTPFSYDADLYVRVSDTADLQKSPGGQVKIAYTILD